MSFTQFVFVPFLAVYLIASALLPQRGWLWLAAIASAVFYAWWDWRFLFLLYYVTMVSWYCGLRIDRSTEERERKFFVIASVVSCLLVLGVFKYFNFFVDSFVRASAAIGMPMSESFARIGLPVGISFYTFHALSYTIDLYRRKLDRAADLLSVAVYLSFFPQLVAGPIVRAFQFLPQIRRGPVFSLRKIKLGLLIIAWGYFLKIAVADSIALLVDPVFKAPYGHSTGDLLLAIFGYAFQIYGDFAGYSFIAIGVAKLQGFDFPANFLAPYFSRSFSEFWRRWHISLSSFLRDYLYIPLGGNRHGKVKEYRNLMVTMLLGGLWHGAAYNFVAWGFLHGLYLSLQRAAADLARKFGLNGVTRAAGPIVAFVTDAIKMAFVFALVLFAWIFFRLGSTSDIAHFLGGIAAWHGAAVVTNKFQVIKVLALIAAVIAVDAATIGRRRVVAIRRSAVAVAVVVAVLAVIVELLGSFGGGAFIYFQF